MRGTDLALRSVEIVKQAYGRALDFHRLTFGPDATSTSWISNSSSIQDVLDVLAATRARYEAKSSKRWRSVAVVVSWWKLMSSRMMQYERVVDTLVSSNPEYAALVWGAMKFLFTVTIHHEEVSSKLAQAFAEIGAVLPEVNFVAQKLYPIEGIQVALANAYAQIIEFCIRATRWYDRIRRNIVKRVLGAVTKTWPLEFQDIRHNIDVQFRRLRELSIVAHQAETRAIHTKIAEIKVLLDTSTSVQQAFGSEATTVRANPSIVSTLPFIKERVSRYLECNTIEPHQTLQLATVMRDRRRARGAITPHGTWALLQLREWISKPESSLLQFQGSSLRSEQSRDFAIDLIQLVKSVKLPVIWFLAPTTATRTPSIIDILRSLIQQITDQYLRNPDSCWLNDSHFKDCATENDWINLFVSVLGLVPSIIIVIDTHQDASEMVGTVCQFWRKMEQRSCTTVVKMLILTYGATNTALQQLPVLKAGIDPGRYKTAIGMRTRPRQTRIVSRFQGRGDREGRSSQTLGPETLKPFVLKLVGAITRHD